MKKTLIFITSYLILLVLFHLIVFKFNVTLQTISDTLFYIGIISFFSGIIAVTNAQNVFIGFRYFLTQLFKKKDDPDKITYSDYRDQKLHTKFTYISVVMVIVGLVFVIASLVIGLIILR